MVTIDIFSSNVNCDRYHLLKFDEQPRTTEIIYTETGDAFNGFESAVLNCSYDLIKDSRLAAFTVNGFNNNQKIYFLIKDIIPIRNDKTLITVEYDVWLNDKNRLRIGEQNYIYEMSVFNPSYPWKPIQARDYYFTTKKVLFDDYTTKWYIVILYHNSQQNEDIVYYIESAKSAEFPFYSYQFMLSLSQKGVDTNNIISIYLSPYSFDVNPSGATHWKFEFENNTGMWDFICYSTYFNEFVNYNEAYTLKTDTAGFGNTPISTDCITDMVGSVVWTSPYNYYEQHSVTIHADLSYNSFIWKGYVGLDTIENRFSIQCIDLGFFLDYFQQYNNIEKAYNAEVREAQLNKQLIQDLGSAVSTGANMGVIGSMGGMGGVGLVGGLAAATVSAGINYAATAKYNGQIEKIEERQAKIQYDMIGSNVLNFQHFINKNSYPAVETKTPDNASINSVYNSQYGYYNRISYHCRVKATDLEEIIQVFRPKYIKGDFDFIGISEKDAIQLNLRFKGGVNFVNWTGAYND